MTPCASQIAAIRASCTSGPWIFPSVRLVLKRFQWSVVSPMTTTEEEPNHASICSIAWRVLDGGSKILGCETMAINSWMQGHGIAHTARP